AGVAGGNDAGAEDIKKAAEAVSSVSGEQILKAIVDAAGGGEQVGAAPGDAKNPIAAAIGAAGGANFHNDMKKKDKVAAALVLRGLAKDGKFSATNANDANVKSAVENAVGKTFHALTELVRKTVEGGLKKVSEAVQGEGKRSPSVADSKKKSQ
ncbi:variable large family protein, partial [Borreliella burgdorferi]|uniref:variable large family protein n=1 Tax=Borreliella burgdorferi TaxID=139 RepID=UPI001E389133